MEIPGPNDLSSWVWDGHATSKIMGCDKGSQFSDIEMRRWQYKRNNSPLGNYRNNYCIYAFVKLSFLLRVSVVHCLEDRGFFDYRKGITDKKDTYKIMN